jgi:hypothetical protein
MDIGRYNDGRQAALAARWGKITAPKQLGRLEVPARSHFVQKNDWPRIVTMRHLQAKKEGKLTG